MLCAEHLPVGECGIATCSGVAAILQPVRSKFLDQYVLAACKNKVFRLSKSNLTDHIVQ